MAGLAVTALLLGGCGRKGDNDLNAAAANQAAAANDVQTVANAATGASASNQSASNQSASALPADFPGSDADARGADCYVYLSMAMQTPGNAAGFDNAAMGQARDQWRSDLRLRLSETETQQLTGSNVNPLADTPAARRDAAAHWCVEHAPEVDPR